MVAGQEEDSEQHKDLFMAARISSASQSGGLSKPDLTQGVVTSLGEVLMPCCN